MLFVNFSCFTFALSYVNRQQQPRQTQATMFLYELVSLLFSIHIFLLLVFLPHLNIILFSSCLFPSPSPSVSSFLSQSSNFFSVFLFLSFFIFFLAAASKEPMIYAFTCGEISSFSFFKKPNFQSCVSTRSLEAQILAFWP